jgi:hypothetical protein
MASDGSRRAEANNYDEGFIATVKHNFKRQTQSLKDHFEKLLEAACPHHPYSIKHNLKDCTTMKKFMMAGAPPRGGKPGGGDPGGKAAAPVLGEAEVMKIFG